MDHLPVAAGTLPSAPFYIAAGLCLLLSLWCTVVGAALGRMTRTEAAEMYAHKERGSARVVAIMARRPAASMGIAVVRALLMASYGICFTFALGTDVAAWWQIFPIFFGVTVLVLLAFAFFNPLSFGVERHQRVLRKATWWLSPLTWLLSLLIREREFSPEEAEQRQEDQLAVMVERVAESEALDDAERDILQSLFDMGNTLVREVMVPRTDMIAVEADETLDRAISLFTRSGFSRVPVYRESIDDVIGVLYLKDVIRRVHRRHQHDELRVADLVREPVFVPETKIIDTLMREMQADQVHIALVVDEYGGIAGLVTIEDLVEELVGEISDEHDRALPAVEEHEAGSFRIPARMPIDDLGDLFGIELEDDDVDTAGGFFAKSIGRVPIRGAETTVAGIHMVADRFEGRRRRLSTIIVAREETDDEGED